jgi:hypothetical protein
VRRPIGHRTSTAKDLGTILANQSDPSYMAAVARQRALVQEGKVWRYNRATGEWYLRKVVDGTVQESQAA